MFMGSSGATKLSSCISPGAPKGGGFDHLFPEDLQHVIAGNAMGGLSCSVVRPGDIFHGAEERNAIGSIGIVLDFQSKDCLVAADPHDCGSIVKNGFRTVLTKKDLSVDDLERDLLREDRSQRVGRKGLCRYWHLRDPALRSVGATTTAACAGYARFPPAGGICTGSPSAELWCAREMFPDQSIFSFRDGEVWRLSPGLPGPIDNAEIYTP